MAHLAIGTPPPTPTLTVSTADLDVATLVQWVIGWIIWIAGVAALIYLLYGGIMFITAGGDSDKVTKARNTILYAVIGLIVVIVALVIFNATRTVGQNVG